MVVGYLNANLLVCLCYVIRACEGAPFDHILRAVLAWFHIVSRAFRKTRLCNVGDR